ncbi:TPA: hypothetical protein ACLBA0_002005, partial [Neisseria meningitidis]
GPDSRFRGNDELERRTDICRNLLCLHSHTLFNVLFQEYDARRRHRALRNHKIPESSFPRKREFGNIRLKQVIGKTETPMPSFPRRRESGHSKPQRFIRSNDNLSIVIPAQAGI